MGLWLSRLTDLLSSWSEGTPSKILLLGLDAAGKTTVLYKIKLNETITSIPTIGFNVETVSPTKGLTFTVWDIGGQERIRRLWSHYFQDADGLIFVVDSSDSARIGEAREELHGILGADTMRQVPVVVMANKQDLPGALTPSQLVEGLELPKLRSAGHAWHVQATCATTGDGLFEALHHMSDFVKQARKERR